MGDDVFGDDPTVNRLQEACAGRFGMEAGLFFPSGTQSNLAALMAHCQRGEEVIVGQDAHTYHYEAGGMAVLGSIQPQPLTNRPDGTLDLAEVEAAIKPDDAHFAITRLIALENTIGGKVLPRAYMAEAIALARRRGLATHLDGARIFNASVKLGMPVQELCAGFDTVSVCLSKGLGTPAGTVLVGRKELIARARRIRKMLGGTMRQVGILAAAGLYALEHNVERLAEDHANAERLGRGLADARAAGRSGADQHGLRGDSAGTRSRASSVTCASRESSPSRDRGCAWPRTWTWTRAASTAWCRPSPDSSARPPPRTRAG